jgi:hypothetical protein
MNRFLNAGGTHRMALAVLPALCILLLAAVGQPAEAGVKKMCMEEVIFEADIVFVGTLVDIQTRWGEGNKMIWTDYYFSVEEVWKGQAEGNPHVVSVGGGTVGGQSIMLSHVPNFETGSTYVVYSYHNARLYAEATVGVEQGIFREVVDDDTEEKFIIDYFGYRMERLDDHTILRGRMTRRIEDTQRAHVLTDQEIYYQQLAIEQERAEHSVPEPVYRDPDGNVIPSRKAPEPTLQERVERVLSTTPQGEPLTREALKAYTLNVLNGDEGATAPSRVKTKGGE